MRGFDRADEVDGVVKAVGVGGTHIPNGWVDAGFKARAPNDERCGEDPPTLEKIFKLAPLKATKTFNVELGHADEFGECLM